MNNIEEIIWHDGILLDFKIRFGKSISVVLIVKVFESDEASSRKKLKLTFNNVDFINCSADTYELIDNSNSGNVSNGYIKNDSSSKRNKFFLYLLDGIINFHFSNVEITS